MSPRLKQSELSPTIFLAGALMTVPTGVGLALWQIYQNEPAQIAHVVEQLPGIDIISDADAQVGSTSSGCGNSGCGQFNGNITYPVLSGWTNVDFGLPNNNGVATSGNVIVTSSYNGDCQPPDGDGTSSGSSTTGSGSSDPEPEPAPEPCGSPDGI